VHEWVCLYQNCSVGCIWFCPVPAWAAGLLGSMQGGAVLGVCCCAHFEQQRRERNPCGRLVAPEWVHQWQQLAALWSGTRLHLASSCCRASGHEGSLPPQQQLTRRRWPPGVAPTARITDEPQGVILPGRVWWCSHHGIHGGIFGGVVLVATYFPMGLNCCVRDATV
jgi:hypothetical protein